ncbi:hypothetical protein QTN47_06510 [Danxiaibacter flavus]|uniref:Uncharacterized protein n=1 Tax=Danxiaibacter flavus TaxID=3049108 RepID=A0ABV3ZF97_9BACT|nr:hypothetical protein QNM32_06510 [Chitinophagaceae bacterium DXS]
MSNTIILLCVAIVILLSVLLVYIYRDVKRGEKSDEKTIDPQTKQMQLQAYERLTLLVDRIALPNLISRIAISGISAKDMQLLLVRNIREEFEYNISQQIYVTHDAWNAVKNLKEQNMLVINQFANALPPNATGLDLNKLLLEFLMNNKKGALHEIVSEVLAYEAKTLL